MRVTLTLWTALAVACTGDLQDQADDNEKAIETELARAEKAESDLEARVAALEATLATLESSVSANGDEIDALGTIVGLQDTDILQLQTDAAAHESRLRSRHDELLFIWDGDGNYLGRLREYSDTVLTYSDGVAPVMVFWSSVGSMDPTLHFHGSSDCNGSSALLATGTLTANSRPRRILVLSTGEVWEPATYESGLGQSASRYAVGTGVSCITGPSAGADSGWIYQFAYQISPYAPGIQIAPMQWD